MRFSLTADQKHFFSQEKHIEFEDLLSESEAEELRIHADRLVAKRMNLPSIEHTPPSDIFLAGRDLWREDPFIKKSLFRQEFAELASLLFGQKLVRLAYDQYVRTAELTGSSPYPSCTSLDQASCLQKVSGALILGLTDPAPGPKDRFSPLPKKKASALFVSGSKLLTFGPLFETPNQALLILAYCDDKTLYIHQPKDPHTHALKKEGYVFGDRLESRTHPILFRS